MRELTQTHLSPGNCLQTAIACILDLDPEVMPDQVTSEDYYRVLNAYLKTHHGKLYVRLGKWYMGALEHKAPGYHLINGFTVRSSTNGGKTHSVVGRYGEMIWDPHPSRDGLIDVMDIGIIMPFPEKDEEYQRIWSMYSCECPACVAGSQLTA
jgi:hypothetical protein